jgi:hypothetical protein
MACLCLCIGYLVPVPVIEHFFTDVERNGKFTGMCGRGWYGGGGGRVRCKQKFYCMYMYAVSVWML